MSNNPQSKLPAPRDVIRLTKEQYAIIERQCPIRIGADTTPEQVAGMLGEQRVLQLIRKEIVIG